ncbi:MULTISPECIES: hypothetical protein [unclassified Nostoc]|uniref:hypothetical protein n=1 Tax=unclassified Nostoc TaxID=2593658 RepID=UPI002AD2BD6E|nr:MULTISPECIES: hypothetical protein [unclassified Nostoc]MDZ8121585.1 hypothetical protein [Nostoc sp. CmiVER01]MDZ8227246.1 hypothetical protein [Nostoc sp. ChiVER01]
MTVNLKGVSLMVAAIFGMNEGVVAASASFIAANSFKFNLKDGHLAHLSISDGQDVHSSNGMC